MTKERRTDGMVRVPGGEFLMGSEEFYPEESPVRRVAVDGFWMDEHPVTAGEFRRFVRETGYVTVAERPLDPSDYPDADPELLVPGALVFRKTEGPVPLDDYRNWWEYVPGTYWKRPGGPGTTVNGRDRHPVVQVAFEDAEAYAAWAGKELPTESEWEYAARGGLEGQPFAWGDEHFPGGEPAANTWQGEFPWQNLKLDGHEGTSRSKLHAERLRPLRHDGQRLGVDDGLLHSRPRPRVARLLCPLAAARRDDSASRHQGRLTPVRAELLPALPACRTTGGGRRHIDGPHRFPLRHSRRPELDSCGDRHPSGCTAQGTAAALQCFAEVGSTPSPLRRVETRR